MRPGIGTMRLGIGARDARQPSGSKIPASYNTRAGPVGSRRHAVPARLVWQDLAVLSMPQRACHAATAWRDAWNTVQASRL